MRALLWFHPAVWWLLAQIHLSREQIVDAEVVSQTGSRSDYMDALLTVARGRMGSDLAPAPLFLKARHLASRVDWLLQESTMSLPKDALDSGRACGAGHHYRVVCGACVSHAGARLSRNRNARCQPQTPVPSSCCTRYRRWYPSEALDKDIRGNRDPGPVHRRERQGSPMAHAVISGPEELPPGGIARRSCCGTINRTGRPRRAPASASIRRPRIWRS